jgi:hypothetical protein
MRAILCASIFHEWREGTYAWHAGATRLHRAPGSGCRLAHCRASMGRLIAGLSVHMSLQGPGIRQPLVYAEDAFPAGGFQPPVPTTTTHGVVPAPASTADEGGAGPATGHAAGAAVTGRTRGAAARAAAQRRRHEG